MEPSCPHLVGTSPAIRTLQSQITAAAAADSKVLITGESGTGKEITARLIHAGSARGREPMVTINCPGIPELLLESELFGHARGSFTGAFRDRQGLLEAAHRGTVFLDEVGEMSLRMQGLLLRFLETGEIQRVGGERTVSRVNTRVIAATNRDLRDQVAAREFRLDLYYRLNVVHVHIPPLRERQEDVPPLMRYFMTKYCELYQAGWIELPSALMAPLVSYDWPGNVRELKNVAERLAIRARTGMLTPDDLPAEIRAVSSLRGPAPAAAAPVELALERLLLSEEPFWSVVYGPFMARDLTRDDLRSIVQRGLVHAHGSFTELVRLFNMPPEDSRRLQNFLRKHRCQIDAAATPPAPEPTVEPSEDFRRTA